jgi:hypothetical protein
MGISSRKSVTECCFNPHSWYKRLSFLQAHFLENTLFIEGPRSRSYGRTAALRLIVQPFVEDEVKDDQFFRFSL